jgi:hypothetical protein
MDVSCFACAIVFAHHSPGRRGILQVARAG